MNADVEPIKGYIAWTGKEGDKYGEYVCEDCLTDDDVDITEMDSSEELDCPQHCLYLRCSSATRINYRGN